MRRCDELSVAAATSAAAIRVANAATDVRTQPTSHTRQRLHSLHMHQAKLPMVVHIRRSAEESKARLGGVAHVDARHAILREILIALARHRQSVEVAA